MLLIVSDSQAIKRFNISSNKYVERTDRMYRKNRNVIACVILQLGYRYRIIRLEYEKLKNLHKHLSDGASNYLTHCATLGTAATT